jgi:hypothetical protein
VQGDKLWFYFSGFRGDATRLEKNDYTSGMYNGGATGVAFLRRDGFASMAAGPAAGVLTTRPVTFSGRLLFVNADVFKGQLRVAVLDQAGAPIAPFTLENSVPFIGDSTLAPMRWKTGADLAKLAGRPVRFQFELTGGALYSFWVSQDETGRSDGYVAAGGPDYTGHKDTVGRAALS